MYRSLHSYQSEYVGDLATAEETRVVLLSTLSTEPIALPPESVGEMVVAFMMLPVLATASLTVITSLMSSMLIIELAFSGVVTTPTSLVAGVLVSMKTPSRLPAIPRPSLISVLPLSSTIVTVKLVESLSSVSYTHLTLPTIYSV